MAHVKALSRDEILKLKAVVLYVINQCGELDYFHLFKILYFADREHYAKYGRRIIQDTFCALPKGPVPSVLFDAIKSKPKKGSPLYVISKSLTSLDAAYYFILSATEKPDMDELSKSDIELLDKSISENKDVSMSDLSEKSHDEAWQSAWNKCHSSEMDPLLMAKSGGASDAMLEYIKENESIDCLFD